MSELKPIYLAMGADVIKRDEAIDRFKSRIDEAWRDFDLEELDASNLSDDEMKAALMRMPVASPFRELIIYHAESLQKSAAEALIAYLKAPHDTVKILLVSEGNFRLTRLKKAVQESGVVIACDVEKGYKLEDQIIGSAKKSYGLTITKGGAQELIKRSGSDMELIRSAFEKLKTVAPGKVIDAETVRGAIAQQIASKPWKFSEALAQRNAVRALGLYNERGEGSDMIFLWYAVQTMRELIIVKSLVAKSRMNDMAATLGGPAWKYKNHVAWSNNFELEELENALIDAQNVEGALKSSQDTDLTFTLWIIGVCQKQTTQAISYRNL